MELVNRDMELVNADISASTKQEPIYRVVDRNPTLSTVVSNFKRGQYLNIPVTIFSSVIYVAAHHCAGVNPRTRGLTRPIALVHLYFGFNLFNDDVRNSAARLMGFLPKDDEVPKMVPKMEKYNPHSRLRHPGVSDAEITSDSLILSTIASLIAVHPDVCGRFRIRSLVTAGLVFGATYASMNLNFRYRWRYRHNEMKPEYPVIDHNPDFSKVVGNFNKRDYLRVYTSTSYSLIACYHLGPKTIVGGWVTAGLLGLVFGFGNSYVESSCRLMGVFLNDDEVARFNKK